MEEHFLKDFVAGVEKGAPCPWYNPASDCLAYHATKEASFADRIDEILTIYRSAQTDKPIGYQIKGVAALCKKYGWSGVVVESEENKDGLRKVSLSVLLLAAYEQGPKTIGRRRGYAEALDTRFPAERKMRNA